MWEETVMSDEQLEKLLGEDFKTAYSGHVEEYQSIAKAQAEITAKITMRRVCYMIGRWLESTITDDDDIPRLDEPFPVKVTGLDIIRMRDSGLLPKGASQEADKP